MVALLLLLRPPCFSHGARSAARAAFESLEGCGSECHRRWSCSSAVATRREAGPAALSQRLNPPLSPGWKRLEQQSESGARHGAQPGAEARSAPLQGPPATPGERRQQQRRHSAVLIDHPAKAAAHIAATGPATGQEGGARRDAGSSTPAQRTDSQKALADQDARVSGLAAAHSSKCAALRGCCAKGRRAGREEAEASADAGGSAHGQQDATKRKDTAARHAAGGWQGGGGPGARKAAYAGGAGASANDAGARQAAAGPQRAVAGHAAAR